MDEKTPLFGMVCVVISQNNKILLLKRSSDKEIFPNLWAIVASFPFSEKVDMAATAVREIKEEVGLEGKILEIGEEIVSAINFEGQEREIRVTPLLAIVSDENVILNGEHTDFKWVNINDLNNYQLAPNIKSVIFSIHTNKYLSR